MMFLSVFKRDSKIAQNCAIPNFLQNTMFSVFKALYLIDLNKRKASIRSKQVQKCMDVNTKVFIKLNDKKRDVYV